jgi:AP2 domain.
MKEIPLTQGFIALVDDEDYEALAIHKWYAHIDGRMTAAARRDKGAGRRLVLMHRVIMGDPVGFDIDHRRHRPVSERVIDNRRGNLRIATRRLNNANSRKGTRRTSSIFKGVSWSKFANRWVAYIKDQGVKIHLGHFKAEGYAALSYDLRAVQLWGDNALTNFPVPGSAHSLFGEAAT